MTIGEFSVKWSSHRDVMKTYFVIWFPKLSPGPGRNPSQCEKLILTFFCQDNKMFNTMMKNMEAEEGFIHSIHSIHIRDRMITKLIDKLNA